ncbi:MAG: cytochrome c biogenesis protein ResB [Parachlamydiaceae bacterium]
MKCLKHLYHFLGGVTFAVILISLTALMVAYGTYLESTTESHQVAAEAIYKSLFFKALLTGYFINILLSALRRWPFKKTHIPFLITHIGLLMIITGTFIKTIHGTQGNLLLIEGSSNSLLQIPEEMVVSIEDRLSRKTLHLPLVRNALGQYTLAKNSFCRLKEYSSHSEEALFAWIHQGKAHLADHPGCLAYSWAAGQSLPKANPLALITDQFEEAIKSVIKEHVSLQVIDRQEKNIATFPLDQIINKKQPLVNGSLEGRFRLHESKEQQPHLSLELDYSLIDKAGTISIDLTGPLAIINQHKDRAFLGQAPITVALKSTLPLTLMQDLQKNTLLCLADEHGRLFFKHFPRNIFESYLAYQGGFEGYGLQAEWLGQPSASPKSLRQARLKTLQKELSNPHIQSQLRQFPPIRIFFEACEHCQVNPVKKLARFLSHWDQQGGWIYPEDTLLPKTFIPIFRHYDWSALRPEEVKSCLWLCHFFKDFDPLLAKGEPFLSILNNRNWPLIKTLESVDNSEEQLALFSQQLFSLGNELPSIPFPQDVTSLARLFTAFLRVIGIHLSHVAYPAEPASTHLLTLESPLFKESRSLPSLKKAEDNIPRVVLIKDDEEIALTLNRFKTGLKWPTKDKRFLLSFHPKVEELPYSIRLHKAKQINYLETEQPFSFESELTFTDKRSGEQIRKVISMNEIHETTDGYRFYLSGLSQHPSGAHIVQLVVNKDPAKAYLTYPGGVLVALGVLLLFWKPRIIYKKRTKLKK